MKVPFGDLKLHYQSYRKDIDTAVHRVLASGHYILGPELDKFEREFADYLGAKYAVGCASGTEAIYLPLAALDIGALDEVITVAHTAVPTISAISMTGATPVFVDIDPETYVMDVKAVEARITPKTKAIVPVHLYGQLVEMEPLLKLAQKHKLPVLEDVAQATGAIYNGRRSGTLGEFGAFSFYPSKNLGAFGDGGAVSTNSKERYERLIMLRNYGQSKRYHHDIIGINSRLDEVQAAILSAQLPHVDEWNQRRREIAARYTRGLKGVVTTPIEMEHCPHVYHLYVIQTDRRDELQSYLMDRGIQCLIHYPIPAHLQKAYAHLNHKPGHLPNTEAAAQRILSLPMFLQMTDDQIELVIEAISEFHGAKKSSKSADAASDLVAQPR